MPGIHDFEMESITGERVPLSRYAGQLCVVVNVASKCGLTPQYAGLRSLHGSADDVTVLAFPCNQFGGQEPGSNQEVLDFARSKYDVDFPMFAKVEVNGDGTCELYRYLKAGHPDEDGNEDVAWNFTKFLVGRDGQVLERFGPAVPPEDVATALAKHR